MGESTMLCQCGVDCGVDHTLGRCWNAPMPGSKVCRSCSEPEAPRVQIKPKEL